MVPRAYWSPAALEVREAQDALLCLEAAHSSGVGTCLEAINEEQGRNACLPQIQDAPAGWVATRRIRSRGVVDAAGGIRLFKAEVQYTLGPAGGEGLSAEAQAVASEHKSLSTSVVHIYAISAPEDMLAEALSARRADQGARQLHREIARDLLTHTHTSAVFDDGPGDKGAPAIKPRIAESPSIVLTGHGAGALVAYQTTMSLLQHYPEALKERLKCITFGMPVMGWQGREQRDSLLRLIAPQLTSTPLLRRDLPCPHFLHIVRQEDVVPATCVCSRKVRRSVAGALSLAARHRDPHTTPSTPPSGHSPYSKPYCDALLSLGDHDAARGGDVTSAGVSEEEEVAGVSPGFPLPTRHDDDSDDSDAAYSPAVILPGAAHAVDARRRDGNAESEGSEGVRGVGGWKGWKGWKKNDTVGLNGSTVDWDLVYKAVRDDVCNVSLPEWWPLGKFWFLCDSVPFDSAPPPSNAGPHAASGSNNNKTRRGEQATQTSAGATTRRDGTLVRVRRWVVQFPYFIQMSQSGVREVFEPWPESVGLLRDMLAGVVENAIDNGTPPKRLLGVQPISSAQLRRRHWAVEHHIGQYINALHSWVGSSEWQISRRRELASSLSTLPTKLESVSEDASAEAEEECSGAHAQPDHDAPQPHMLGACPGINGAKTTYGEVAACQVRADGGECRCIHDGVRTLLQITLRGHNLHFVEAVQLCLYSWGVSQTDAHLHQSLSASSPPRAAVAGAGVGGARGDEGRQTGQASTGANEAFLKVRMVVSRSESGSSRLVATCDAPHGWIGAGVEARLLGSCIGEVFVKCDASGLTSFRALHPAVASLENAPVCTLLEQALLLQDLVLRRSNQHAAHSQAVGEASAVQQKRARRPVQIGDVTASSMHLPYLDLTTAEGAEIVEEVVAELMNLEHKTRSQWSDFMRTISLGGLDPHASHTWSQRAPPHSLSASPKTQSGNWRLAATCDGDESVDIGAKVEEDEDEISSGRKTMKLRVAAQLRAQRRKLACLKEIDQLLSRPLSLSMDRSPRLKQIMGLTLGISAGATIMAGSCLLAPYAAASVMPAMAAYVTPAHAVTGMFATSMVGTHMQARCTIDGSYMDKLRHFAGALRIQTSLIRSRAMYLEAAIATRVLNHVSSVLSLSPICSMTELLAKPALFVSVLAQPDSWRRLIDARHYFEFLDFKDKKFVLDFLWVMVTMHRVRAELVSTVSVAVVAPNISSPLNQALLSNLFPTAFARGAVEDASGGQVVEQGSGGDMEQQDADDEERGWKLESYQLPIAAASVRVDTINLPHAYLAHKLEVQDQAAQDPAAHHYSSDTRQSTSTSPNNGKGVWSAKRAELVRGLAAAEVLVVGWHEASLAGTMLLIGRLLARRASSTLPQAPHEFMTCGGTDCRSIRKDCSSSRKVADTGSERGFAFKVLLTGVPRGDSGALAWLADKINRKLDVTRWRSFIAVARRRMRMQRPECLDASFLETVAHEAVQELDLRPTDVPDVVDIELLLASGALDDDWLTRPKLQLETADMLPLTYLADQDDACHAQSEGAQSSSLHPSALHPSAVANKPQVAPAFSLLHDVADKKAQAQQQLPSEKLQPVNGQAEVKVVHLEMLAVEHVSLWLVTRLQAVMAPGGAHAVGGYSMRQHGLTQVESALRPHTACAHVCVLQAVLRRSLQRSMMVIEDYNGADASWSYSRCDKHAPVLPYGTYWPLVHAGAQSRGARLGQEEHLSHLVPNYGHTDCQRRLSLEALIHARARFRRGLERVLQVYLLYSARLRMLDRYYHELLRAAGSMREARSGRRHPMSVLQQLFGLAHGTTTHGNDARLDSLSTAILPEELLFNDTEEGCGVSYWLVELLRGLPLGDEALGECYQVRLGPVYVSLAQDMCRLPLYSNHSLTQLMEELVSAGASCTPPMATVLRSLSSQGPPLEHVLYASVPPGLQLRVSLSLLLDVCPATHPDQQHLRSALQHIDSTFAIAPLLNNLSQGSWELRCPSILGRLGAFFSMLESRFDAAKRNTISRGPVVQAHLELLAEAVDAIQAFCARLSRDLVDTLASSLDAPAPLPVHEVRGAAEADDTGWEFVARGLDNDDGPDSISQLVAIERSVNSVVLTRLWPTLEDLVSGVEREKDARIALGLPAFGWDQKGMANLLHHLAIPHFLLSQHTLAASDEKSSEELDQGVPVFYASCAEALGEMARAKTPHHKAAALAAASRAILLCLEHHFVNTQQSSSMDQVGSGGSNISVLTVLHKCLAFTVLSMAHQNHSSSFRRDALYIRCLHVPCLSVGRMEGARAKTRYGMHSPQTQDVPDVSEHLKDVQELLAADVAVMVGEFEEVLEWIDAEISRMLRPKRVSTSFLDGVETEVEVEVDGSKGTAYGALLEAGATNDWNEVLRLLEYPDPAHNFMLRAWQLVSTPPLDGQQEDDAKKARSALHAAALGGHEAMVLYLMYKTAIGMPTDAKPGDHAFCSTVCEAVKQLPAGAARARADYSFRALVMLRGQHSYTQRLDVLCEAVGEKQDWMDEEEEGLFSACFADLKVNAELGRAVARELDAWIASCVQKRSVLQGLLSTSALVNSIIFCIKSVQHQFERLDQLARPRLSKPSSLSSRWRVFVQQIEANMGQRQGLAGQALSDMLCWPLQRSMRYKDLLLDLIHGAACCSPGRKEPIGSSGVCPKDILDAVAKDYGPPSGAGSGGTRSGGTCQSSARQEVIELATRVDQAHLADKAPGPGMGAELLGALAVLFRVKDETMLLNVKVAEIASRREAADKACFYLENMQGAQHVVSSHCEFVAHCSATCRLPEGPGTWSQGKTLKVLLLRGTRRQLLFYTEALGVSGTTRTCLLKVDMSSVISISEPQESDATTGVAAKASKEAGMQEGGGVRETYTMTLQLRSQDGTSSSADQSESNGVQIGKLVTSVLTLSPPIARSVGAGFKAAGGLEIERLRHLVLCARLLMRDEEAKRLSVSLKRHVSFT